MKTTLPGPDDNQPSVREWLADNPQLPVLDAPTLDCGPDSQVAA